MGQPEGSRLADYGRSAAASLRRVFPPREIMLRTGTRVRFFRIPSGLQLSAAAALTIFGGWAAFASVSYVFHDDIIAAKNNEILNTRLSYRNLLNEVSDYQNKVSALTSELDENHGQMLNLVETNEALQKNLKSAETKREDRESKHRQVVAMREALKSRLDEIEREMHALNTHNFELMGNLNIVATDLEQAISDRDDARAEGRRLQGTVDDLERKLADLHESEKDIVARLTETTTGNIETIEKVLARTGLDVEKLLPRADIEEQKGQGGPLIAATPDNQPALRLKAKLKTLDSKLARWDDLQELMHRLPLQPPLDFYSVSSHYGKRRDPINRRWAMHYGTDMTSRRRAPIYATAAGTVTFAGYKGRYGRLVVIAHGQGLQTKYGHLHKILVKKGQKVEYRHKIGLLGNTGRSTGPHLHYELHVNGRPRNPWKFIKAGRYVHQR